MNIVIAGGTGFLGRALTDALTRDGHDIAILTRQSSADRGAPPRIRTVAWTPDGQSGAWAAAIDTADNRYSTARDYTGTPRPKGAGPDLGAYER